MFSIILFLLPKSHELTNAFDWMQLCKSSAHRQPNWAQFSGSKRKAESMTSNGDTEANNENFKNIPLNAVRVQFCVAVNGARKQKSQWKISKNDCFDCTRCFYFLFSCSCASHSIHFHWFDVISLWHTTRQLHWPLFRLPSFHRQFFVRFFFFVFIWLCFNSANEKEKQRKQRNEWNEANTKRGELKLNAKTKTKTKKKTRIHLNWLSDDGFWHVETCMHDQSHVLHTRRILLRVHSGGSTHHMQCIYRLFFPFLPPAALKRDFDDIFRCATIFLRFTWSRKRRTTFSLANRRFFCRFSLVRSSFIHRFLLYKRIYFCECFVSCSFAFVFVGHWMNGVSFRRPTESLAIFISFSWWWRIPLHARSR